MLIWLTALLLTCPAAATQDAEVAELIRRLDDEDAAVRGAASSSLRKLGTPAIPALVETLVFHSSAEVRSRAADILGRIPEYAVSCVLNDPEFPAARRLWNGIIDTLIAKKPVAEALWEEFGRAGPEEKAVEHGSDPKGPYRGAWILARLREEGARAFNRLARTYGIAGERRKLNDVFDQFNAAFPLPLPDTLASRLLEIGVDETTFEELYGTILLMHDMGLADWFGSLTNEGWDVVLKVLVHLRRKGEAKPMATAVGREEAWTLVCRGPWIRGIASALGRAFAAEKEREELPEGAQRLEAYVDLKAGPPATKELVAIYRSMLRLDRAVGATYFTPGMLASRPAQLPDPKYLSTVDRTILKRIPGQAEMDGETRCVAESIVCTMTMFVGGWDKSFVDRQFDSNTLRLIPALARRVVEAARP